MASISDEAVEAAFEAAERCYLSGAQAKDEAAALNQKHAMNLGSARDFIQNYAKMRSGQRYTRTLNGFATNLFLKQIEKRHGLAQLAVALHAVRQHVAYYESLGHGRLNNIRQIVATYDRAILTIVPTHEEELAEVDEALALDPEVRKAAAESAVGKPRTSVTSVIYYYRNRYVAAEALARAAGICEACQQPAPFARKSNGQPYLEIHHKQRLADDGADTIGNVIALCPNCHRKAHYGWQPEERPGFGRRNQSDL